LVACKYDPTGSDYLVQGSVKWCVRRLTGGAGLGCGPVGTLTKLIRDPERPPAWKALPATLNKMKNEVEH